MIPAFARNARPRRFPLFNLQRRALLSTSLRVSAPRKQSIAPLAPLGVRAALEAAPSISGIKPQPKILEEFKLTDRVAIVSGGNGGLGLEMAMVLCEAGARAVYCVDLQPTPSESFQHVASFVSKMPVPARLEYRTADVTNQEMMWQLGEDIGNAEGRMDICVAAAGILKPNIDCLDYPAATFREVMDVNVNGVMFTAQAAGRQMRRFKTPGSIILIASMSGTVQNRGHQWVSYNTSKSAVLQMGRSMACELAVNGIRVNTISPGHIYTPMTAGYLDKFPELLAHWSDLNPTGRIGRTDEVRGLVAWLASDASTYMTGSDILIDGGHHAW
ncbi:sorbose reductase sou1 [Cylindrobasidium torrendii FP15055 ss-10]|uniref:Sorbose reductase sou1 n=1 Tax=Cylindrobasidium torrendii FP15055 ss-10 TaxID=1314674 RepID=A0A0D7BBE3_9AGAR|nr:sorbose reductase sou1 [Cylindrobasidium torrendii FP15055 ss-10]